MSLNQRAVFLWNSDVTEHLLAAIKSASSLLWGDLGCSLVCSHKGFDQVVQNLSMVPVKETAIPVHNAEGVWIQAVSKFQGGSC